MTVKTSTAAKYNKSGKKKTPVGAKFSDRDQTRVRSLEKLREALFERRDSLRRSFSDEDAALDSIESPVQVGDAIDAALESAESEMEYHFFEAGSREFGQIERAIKRFEEGTYGFCEDCDSPIPIARLKVLPFACKCVKCQQSDEDEQNRSSFRGWRSYDYAATPASRSAAEKEYEFQ